MIRLKVVHTISKGSNLWFSQTIGNAKGPFSLPETRKYKFCNIFKDKFRINVQNQNQKLSTIASITTNNTAK